MCVCHFNVLLGLFDFVTLCYNFFVCVLVCSTEIGKLDFCVDKNAALFREKRSIFIISDYVILNSCNVLGAKC